MIRTPPRATDRLPQTVLAEGVVDPTSGVTWRELSSYYESVSELMLTQLRERPVTLVRALSGVGGPLQVQAHPGAPMLRDVATLAPALDPGQPPLLEIRAATGLQSAAEAGTVELHTWNSTVRAIRKPDRIVFRLEPGAEPDGDAGWPQLREAAASVRAVLSELGLKSFLKTSGATGLHVLVPLMPSRSWQFVEQFANALVAHVVHAVPGRFVDAGGRRDENAPIGDAADGSGVSGAWKRDGPGQGGRVFIDARGNGWGATAACAWTACARPGLGISVPVAWDELDGLTSGAHWTVRDAARRIVVGNRPWEHYAASRQGLATAVKALGFEDRGRQPRRSPTGKSGSPPMWMHDTPPAPETPPPPGPPPTPVTPDGDPIQPVSDPLAPGHPEPVREPPVTRPPATL